MDFKKVKSILVYSPKGGVGKTALALALALQYDCAIVTNDPVSIVKDVLPSDRVDVLPEFRDIWEFEFDGTWIFDFGGYPDARLQDCVYSADMIVTPMLPYRQDRMKALNVVEELLEHCPEDRIVLVVNKAAKKRFEETRDFVEKFYPKLKVFNIKESSVFSWMIEQKKAVAELAAEFPAFRRHWTPVAEQIEELANYLASMAQRREYE